MPKTQENVNGLLAERVREFGDKTFLIAERDDRRWSYKEFDDAVSRAANLLVSRGMAKGDVISLLMPNSPEYIIAYFACWRIGAIAGPINSLLKDEEIRWVRENSGSKLLLSEPPASAGGQLLPDKGGEIVSANLPPADAGGSDLSVGADDDAIVIYTSGTTGKPKGCLLTHGNLLANARQIAGWMNFGPNDRLLTVMPLFHMNAVSVTTMTALYAGGSTVVSPKFSASRFWEIIEKYQITSFGSVATMLSMLLERGSEFRVPSSKSKTKDQRPKTESLRFAMCGSAPVPAVVLRKFEKTFDCLVIEGYGLSESTCRSTFNPPNKNRRPGSCGKPIGNEMKIVDENDKDVADGELGEIVLRGENIFKGYYKNPEATAKAFAGGWFHTGDIGYRDADGFFYIADRKSDMIIRGGENIYPREIDDLLYTHQAVAEAAVIGVPDALYGEEVAAFVVLKDGMSATAEELMAFCRQHLADFKCPKTITFLNEIPKGPTGKLLKRELSALADETNTVLSKS